MTAPSSPDPYSPHLRTALLLTGTGTAGAYHAGVLRALHEAGVKIDVVAARGAGVVGALFAAIDGSPRLWDENGLWRGAAVKSLYGWRRAPRVALGALALAVLIVALPLLAMAAGLMVFPIDFVLKMAGMNGGGLTAAYLALAQAAFAPGALPTWLPRLALLVLGAGASTLAAAAWSGRRTRRRRGPFWWRILTPPLAAEPAARECWRAMWDLMRGAAHVKQPAPADLARRYTELLGDNLGQPGFRELLIAVHDLDTHRDIVFALVAESRRRDLFRRATSEAADARRAEVLELAGTSRDHLADAIAASLTVPLASEPHVIRFAPDAYWRGEAHRACDRPGVVLRLVDELLDLGVEQIVLVSAAPEAGGPHELQAPRSDARGRLGEYLHSADAAMVRDAIRLAAARMSRMYVVRPAHNPIGPFDFGGGFDDRSDRRQPLGELLNRGYEDAYRQFIEPVVGASGERVGQVMP